MNTTRAAAEAHSSGGVSPITRAAASASASASPASFAFTPVLRGYEDAVFGRYGIRGRSPQIEPRHGHGACPRAAKARPADAVPPLLISPTRASPLDQASPPVLLAGGFFEVSHELS